MNRLIENYQNVINPLAKIPPLTNNTVFKWLVRAIFFSMVLRID